MGEPAVSLRGFRMLKRILMVAGILAGVAAIVMAIAYFEDRRLSKLTATAPGQVTRVVIHTDSESDESSTIVHFVYAVDGETLSDQSTKAGDASDTFLQGAAVTVCYDPAKPAETEVYQPGRACPPR